MDEPKHPKLTVICVCPGIGFPFGQANTNRITCIGKAIVEGGGRFLVWHIGTSPNRFNTERKGVWNGIEFEYMGGRVSRPANKWIRSAVNVVGIVRLFFRLLFSVTGRKNMIVFFDLQHSSINILLAPFCRLLGITSVQEVNEWWPDVKKTPRIISFQYKKIMFRHSNASFVISKDYQNKVRRTTHFDPDHKFFYLPVLADPLNLPHSDELPEAPFLFWCGDVIGYMKDIIFMVRAFAQVQRHFPDLRLIISGKYSADNREQVFAELEACGLPASSFSLTGFVDDRQLLKYVQQAKVVLAPMWNDEKSNTRFPTKLGLYAFAEKLIVTAPVGELKEYFVDGQNCLFYEPGNAESLAQKIMEGISNGAQSAALGRNARLLAEKTFSYKNYVRSIPEFFRSL